MAGVAKIWQVYQEPSYATVGSPITVYFSVKNVGDTSSTLWINASYNSSICINNFRVGIPAGMVWQWMTCQCGNLVAPYVMVHIEVGHVNSSLPDDVYDCVVYPGSALVCSADGPYLGVPSESIQFSGFGQGGVPPYAFLWDFGDGGTSTLQNPQHTYQTEGAYNVSLVVNDNDGRNTFDHTTTTIQISPPPPQVRCWQCSPPPNGSFPIWQDFPTGTICGLGDAVDWPYTSEPVCPPQMISCYRCPLDGGTVPEQQEFEGTTCPTGWISTIPSCETKPFPWILIGGGILGIGAIGYLLLKKKR
jgi:hypothetical protein